MLWLDSADSAAPALPATWLIATGTSPRNLAERSALRRGTARWLLARQLGCQEADVVIGHDPAGRPLLVRPMAPQLNTSLATRAGVVAVALAPHAVGVDVERIDTQNAPPLDVLHPEERRFLDATAQALRAPAFARLWAAKEAYVKALGLGFRQAPESFVVSLLSETVFRVTDPSRAIETHGHLHIMKNGGQDALAAAVIVLEGG